MDVTGYLKTYSMTAHELAMAMIQEVLHATGITATAGIGTNLYLAKVAMDIVAKHVKPDKDGVRIAELDEQTYREKLWCHQPLTDFWRVGHGLTRRLEKLGCHTMGDLARMSLTCEDLLYKTFGINAELLIDHAWGREPTTIADIKNYKSKSKSLSSTQVLMRDYKTQEAEVIVKEMADQICLDMAAQHLVTESVTLFIGYSHTQGVPGAGGTARLAMPTNGAGQIVPAIATLYKRIVNPSYVIRRVGLCCNNVFEDPGTVQLNLFEDTTRQLRDKALQESLLGIRAKYGKNSILKGMNYTEAATARQRNRQIGGHKSGTG
jgi:DNA polymerase V